MEFNIEEFIIHHLVETYHHIRYARAGRFEDPVVEPFAGAVEDSGPLTACPQNSFRLSFLMVGHDELTQTEDCHFLSIYTPSRKGARPVLVWIHGGAYLAGSGEEAAYDGSMLAEDGDIVVVTSLTPFRTPQSHFLYQTIVPYYFVHQKTLLCTKLYYSL